MLKKIQVLFFPHDHRPGHIKSLDGLRGFAVLIVVFSHLSRDFYMPIDIRGINKVGVGLFFLLSAYLLDNQIVRKLNQEKADRSFWMNYFFRRFIRIYPLLIISLLVYYYYTPIYFPNGFIDSGKDIFQHILLLNGEHMYWSIPVEFKYYFISPILLYYFRVVQWKFDKIITVMLLLLTISFAWAYISNTNHSTLSFLPIFLIGTSFSIVENLKPGLLEKGNWNILSVGSLVLFIIFLPFFWKFYDMNLPLASRFGVSIFGLLLSGIFLGARYGILRHIFQNYILRFFGVISFSLYIFHLLIIRFFLDNPLPKTYYNTIAVFVLSTILSVITYLLIELPFSKISLHKLKIAISNVEKIPVTISQISSRFPKRNIK